MLKGVNDAPDHARELADAAAQRASKVNLIPFNPFPDSGFEGAEPERVRRFQKVLIDEGYVATIRKTRGDDIDAACGQLAGQVVNRMKPRAVRIHPAFAEDLMRTALARIAMMLAGCVSQKRASIPSRSRTTRSPSAHRRAEVHTALAGEYISRGNFGVALDGVAASPSRTTRTTCPRTTCRAWCTWSCGRTCRRARPSSRALSLEPKNAEVHQQLRLVPVHPRQTPSAP